MDDGEEDEKKTLSIVVPSCPLDLLWACAGGSSWLTIRLKIEIVREQQGWGGGGFNFKEDMGIEGGNERLRDA